MNDEIINTYDIIHSGQIIRKKFFQNNPIAKKTDDRNQRDHHPELPVTDTSV